MPAIQYPFIDIAVHPRVRERFARGEAMVLFSVGMERVLWANGAGADLFGYDAIYDFLDQGPKAGDVSFRQLQATARGLAAVGDSKSFLIRMASGFQRAVVNAAVEKVRIQAGEEAVLFSSPVSSKPLAATESARRMLDGFDDPDTHMAVIGRDGEVIASSPGFVQLGVTSQTARMLTTMAGAQPERLIKRPIPTGRGYLPAAVGKLSEIPALHLLFVVETVLGHLDPMESLGAPATAATNEAASSEPEAEEARRELEAASEPAPAAETMPATENPSPEVIDAVAGIEDVEEPPEATAEIAEQEEEPAQSDAAMDDVAGLALMEGATPEQIDAATDEDDVIADADNDADADTEPQAAEGQAEQVDAAGTQETAAVEPEHVEQPEPIEEEPTGFAFKRNGRATRFVWKIDAEGRFSEVSREFAEAVGPHASTIIGAAFTDIAARFSLDPDGKVAELLARRDTWSGRTIFWPIENTGLKVPVDLAALPTYTRSRDFDGFRGFGVVRLSDAIEDPLKLGMTFSRQAVDAGAPERSVESPAEQSAAAESEPEPETAADTAAETQPRREEETAGTATISDTDGKEAEASVVSDAAPEKVEPPALKIAETPNRRESDKIIQLHERRPASFGTLSPSEQAAFREIAKQLEPLGAPVESPAEPKPTEDVTKASAVSDATNDVAADSTDTPADIEATEKQPPVPAEPDVAQNTAHEEPAAGDDAAPAIAEASGEPEEDFNPLDVLNTAVPPRVKMRDGLSAEIVDQLPLAVLIHAGDRLIHGNPEFLRLTGYDNLDELQGVGGLDALLQRHDLEENTERPGTMMVVRADDDLVPVTARLQSIRWEDGTALMLALMPVEKSATALPAQPEPQPEAEEPPADRMVEKLAKLQVEIEELRSTLETATDGVVIIGPEGDIRSMNRSASALFNYDDQETRGKPFVMLFAHESQKAVLDYLGGLSGHGVASVLNDGREVIGREASGGFVPLFMTMGKLTSSNGYCAVIRDITQWKRTEEELRNAKRAAETANAHKTDFLARVSHEIRTPLNAIIGFSDMMAGERFGPIGHSRYIEYANDIGRSGRHVLDIVNDLLDISKIEAGEMDLEFAAVGLNEAIAEAVSLVQPQANSQRVIIRTALSQSVPNVVADLRSVKQIALNILSNAIRFTPSGGQIVVSTSYEANGSVVMRIRDTGVGMTRTELEQAMKPFRQVSTNSRKRGDGTGLGLPLTKAMVDANRATFSIHSAPNEGTLVEVSFPSPRVLAT